MGPRMCAANAIGRLIDESGIDFDPDRMCPEGAVAARVDELARARETRKWASDQALSDEDSESGRR